MKSYARAGKQEKRIGGKGQAHSPKCLGFGGTAGASGISNVGGHVKLDEGGARAEIERCMMVKHARPTTSSQPNHVGGSRAGA